MYSSMRHQRTDELAAAEYPDVLAWLLFELGHGIRGVARQQCGVDPRERLGQGRRRGTVCRRRHAAFSPFTRMVSDEDRHRTRHEKSRVADSARKPPGEPSGAARRQTIECHVD
jgi:hypothetical protein